MNSLPRWLISITDMPLPCQSSISSAAWRSTGSGSTAGPALKLMTRDMARLRVRKERRWRGAPTGARRTPMLGAMALRRSRIGAATPAAGAGAARRAGALARAQRRAANLRPTRSRPPASSAQVEGSGTAAAIASSCAATRCSVSASATLMPRSFAACSSAPSESGSRPVMVPNWTSASRYEPYLLACR